MANSTGRLRRAKRSVASTYAGPGADQQASAGNKQAQYETVTPDDPAQKESDERYRAVVEQVSDAIFLLDVDTMRLLVANSAFSKLLGYSAAEIPGLRIYDLLPYEPERIDIATMRALEQEEYRASDRLYRHKDGSLVDVEVRITPISYNGRKVLCEVLRDISERKQIKAALSRSEQELTDFFENAAVGLHWVGANGTVLRVNQAELDMLGYTREEYVGHNIAEFHADQLVIEDILQRLTKGETLHNYEAALYCKDGSTKHVLISSNVLRQDGEFIHTRCFTRDITDRKRAEEQHASALRAREELFFIVSHDLKNPLQIIKGVAQILKRSLTRPHPPEPERLLEGLNRIEATVTKMNMLINDVLDFARLQAGEPLPLQRATVDLVTLCRQIVEDYRQSTDGHEIRFETALPEFSGLWDSSRLERVLGNLLSNAIKYNPKGTEITIKLEREEGEGRKEEEANKDVSWAVLTVRDNGRGIRAHDLPHIFDWYHWITVANVSEDLVRPVSGAGIGLAGARQAIEEHGGTIEAASEEGAGSTFTVRLPVTF